MLNEKQLRKIIRSELNEVQLQNIGQRINAIASDISIIAYDINRVIDPDYDGRGRRVSRDVLDDIEQRTRELLKIARNLEDLSQTQGSMGK